MSTSFSSALCTLLHNIAAVICRGKTITKCCLSSHSGHFYFGTEGGDVYTLDLKHFRIDPDFIKWTNATTL